MTLELKDSPAYYAWRHLGLDLYGWQAEALQSIGWQAYGGPPTAIVAANGSGKTTAIIGPAVSWFFDRYPRGKCVITSSPACLLRMWNMAFSSAVGSGSPHALALTPNGAFRSWMAGVRRMSTGFTVRRFESKAARGCPQLRRCAVRNSRSRE